MSFLRKFVSRTSFAARSALKATSAGAPRVRLLSTSTMGKKPLSKSAVFGTQPVRKLAAAGPPQQTALSSPNWVVKGFLFPQLKGLFDTKNFEKKNNVVWQQWGPFPDIDICWVYNSNADFNDANAGAQCGNAGPSTALMRFKPNSKVPPHWHAGVEHILYLQGSQTDERGVWNAGDFIVNPTGSDHWQAVTGPQGCIVLTIWERSALPLIPPAAK